MKSEIIQHKVMKELGKRTSGCGRIQEKGAVRVKVFMQEYPGAENMNSKGASAAVAE